MEYANELSSLKHVWLEPSSSLKDENNTAVIYVSHATEELGLLGMTYLFLKSYSNNKLLNITGMLCYDGRLYGMLVEGEKNNVERLCKTVENDLRHKILYKQQINQSGVRRFNEWTMRFRGAEAIARVMPCYAGVLSEIGDGKSEKIKDLIGLYGME